MKKLIALYEYAEDHGIDVDWCTMLRAESLSVKLEDGSCAIAIDPFKLTSTADETSKLAEYFEVPEDLIQQAVDYYTGPCGLSFRDNTEDCC